MIAWALFLLSTVASAAPDAGVAPALDLQALLGKLAEQQVKLAAGLEHLDYTRFERHEELDSDLRPVHAVERAVRVVHAPAALSADGGRGFSLATETLVREARDGLDITAETRPRFDEAQEIYRDKKQQDPKRKDTFEADSPFKPSEQAKYQFRLAGPDAKDPSLLRITFVPNPGRAATPEQVSGEARVDARTGYARTVAFRPAALPRFVTRQESTQEFDFVGTVPVLKRFTFAGEGGVLFMKNRFRGETEYRDFKAF